MKIRKKLLRPVLFFLLAALLISSLLIPISAETTEQKTEEATSKQTEEGIVLDELTLAAIKMINNLPFPVTLQDKKDVENARLLYDLITDESQRALVPYKLLEQAEMTIASLEAGADAPTAEAGTAAPSEGATASPSGTETGTESSTEEKGEEKPNLKTMLRSFFFCLIGILLLVFMLFLAVTLRRIKRVSLTDPTDGEEKAGEEVKEATDPAPDAEEKAEGKEDAAASEDERKS